MIADVFTISRHLFRVLDRHTESFILLSPEDIRRLRLMLDDVVSKDSDMVTFQPKLGPQVTFAFVSEALLEQVSKETQLDVDKNERTEEVDK